MFEGQSHLYLIKGAASHPLHHHGDEKCPGAPLQLTNCTHKPHVINFGRIYPSLCELHDVLFLSLVFVVLGWEHNRLPTPSWVTTTKATKC